MNKKSIIAREMSWLSFNARVLQEASDPNVSLKNRIRFLGIYSNNRDEFFRRRMAALKQLIRVNAQNDKDNLGKNPKKILDQIYRIILQQQEEFNPGRRVRQSGGRTSATAVRCRYCRL